MTSKGPYQPKAFSDSMIFILHRLGLLGKLLSQQPFVIYGMLPSFGYDF